MTEATATAATLAARDVRDDVYLLVTEGLSYAWVDDRVISCGVTEIPANPAMEANDSVWTSDVFSGHVGGLGPLIDYPYQRLSETSPAGHPRGGT